MNLTMTIDAKILKQARRAAMERHVSLTSLVRDYLQQLASKETDQSRRTALALKSSFARNRRKIGKVTWSREDLHAR
jgi:hypothetical protein